MRNIRNDREYFQESLLNCPKYLTLLMMNSYLISYAIISNFIGRFIESITIKFQKQLCDEEFTEKSISECMVSFDNSKSPW